jgi:hypothetical protein
MAITEDEFFWGQSYFIFGLKKAERLRSTRYVFVVRPLERKDEIGEREVS